MTTSTGIDIFQSNSFELDLDKMERLKMSDKQRQNALKLSDKLRRLSGLRDHQLPSNTSDEHASLKFADLDTNAFEDSKRSSSSKSKIVDVSKIQKQISDLELEIEDLVDLLAHSLGYGDDSQKRRRIQISQLDDDVDDDFMTETSHSKGNQEIQTLESVKTRLAILYENRDACKSIIADQSSKKNSTANDDEDIDPLDAFMASTEAQLANEDETKEKIKLELLEKEILDFEKLFNVLSKNQFSDASVSAAIQQQSIARKHIPVEPAPNRGAGSVWEDEFRKDETVPVSIKRSNVVNIPASSNVRLDTSRPGLQVPGSTSSAPASWRPPSDDDDNKLGKKLGY